MWSWHWPQAIVVPIQTDIVVLTRSTIATLRYSSWSVPPSLLVFVLRWKAVAMSLLSRRIGQQVAGDLLDRELVERLVGVERADHVVAIGPDRPRHVGHVAGRIGIAGQVEPHPRPVLAEPFRASSRSTSFSYASGFLSCAKVRPRRSVGGRPVRSASAVGCST